MRIESSYRGKKSVHGRTRTTREKRGTGVHQTYVLPRRQTTWWSRLGFNASKEGGRQDTGESTNRCAIVEQKARKRIKRTKSAGREKEREKTIHKTIQVQEREHGRLAAPTAAKANKNTQEEKNSPDDAHHAKTSKQVVREHERGWGSGQDRALSPKPTISTERRIRLRQ